MIAIILKCYALTLISIGLTALFIMVFGIYIFSTLIWPKRNRSPRKQPLAVQEITPIKLYSNQNNSHRNNHGSIDHSDIAAIAGDDPVATQLDLACAYLESGQCASAKKILLSVATLGSISQQKEAQQLLTTLKNTS